MEQRTTALQGYFNGAPKTLRPLVVSLNGDNSWLISIPRPGIEQKGLGKAYFHIVSGPWLVGPAIQFSSWMVHMTLSTPAVFENGNDIERLVDDIEAAAATAGFVSRSTERDQPLVDIIFIETYGADHCHEPTLKTFDRRIPVFAAKDAADTIRPWKFFAHVTTINDLKPGSGKWKGIHPGAELPLWLNIFRVVGQTMLNFATALVWESEVGGYESLALSPHVIKTDIPSFQTLANGLNPAIDTLAIFCPIKTSYSFGFQTVLGAPGALAIERKLKPRYWVKSADALLLYQGLVLKGVSDVWGTLDEALEQERSKSEAKLVESLKRPNLVEVQNGECFVLK